MTVKSLQITIQIPWAQSLKDKRMVIKSLLTKIRDRFNVSVAEVAHQDVVKTAVIGIVCVAGDSAQADSVLDHVLCFVENRSEGELTDILREVR